MSKDLELESWIDEQDADLDREAMVADMWTSEAEELARLMAREALEELGELTS